MTLAGQLLRGGLVALSLAWAGLLAYTLAAPFQGWPELPTRTAMVILAALAVAMVVSAVLLVMVGRRQVIEDADVLVAVAGPQARKCRKALIAALGEEVSASAMSPPQDVAAAWELFAESESPLMAWRPAHGAGVLMVADMPWLSELGWAPRQPNALQLPMLPTEAWSELGLFVRGLAEFHAGDPMLALETWGGLESLAEASAIWQGLAWEAMDNHEAARDWYASIDLPEARFNLARAQTLLGEIDSAEALWREILRHEPDCGAARYWLGTIYREQGRPQDAVTILQPAADDDAPACWALAGDILGDVGVWGLASKAYALALERADDGELWRRYGHSLEMQGRLHEGIEATERSVEIEATAANLTQWGHQLGQLGRWDEALPLFEQAYQLDDEYPDALFHWGQALEELCRWEEAIVHYERLVMLHPSYQAARMSLATLLLRRGDVAAAGDHFQQALATHPMPADVQLRWATSLAQVGHWQEAMGRLEEVIRLDPRSAVAYHYLGLGLIQLGRTQEALRFFRRAYELEPTNHQALIDWGIALGQLGHFDKALARFEAVLAQAPQHPRALFNKGIACHRLGRSAQAAEAFRTILAADPTDAQAHFELGKVLDKLGRTEEALAHTTEAGRLLGASREG